MEIEEECMEVCDYERCTHPEEIENHPDADKEFYQIIISYANGDLPNIFYIPAENCSPELYKVLEKSNCGEYIIKIGNFVLDLENIPGVLKPFSEDGAFLSFPKQKVEKTFVFMKK